ncbi:MAG: arsenate reductase ArsC [Burkholderiales bacterium]
MSNRVFNVLFLCTGNSARSILAEAYINASSRGNFRGFSAGSHPAGEVQPFVLDLLKKNRLPTDDLRSKSWDEFEKPDAPHMDFVITVCDRAAGEVCPVWPGQPIYAHWGIEDPAAIEGSVEEKRAAYLRAYTILARRIGLMTSLPLDRLDRYTTEQRLKDIGKER